MYYTDKIIKGAVVSEKSNILSSKNQYVFDIYPNTNRIEVAKAIAAIYKVTVTRVNILNRPPKRKMSRIVRNRVGTTQAIRRAIVTLKEGDKIELI